MDSTITYNKNSGPITAACFARPEIGSKLGNPAVAPTEAYERAGSVRNVLRSAS